jgi:transposase
MKLSVEQILNLQEMKVLNSDEIEGLGLVIEIQRNSECARCIGRSASISRAANGERFTLGKKRSIIKNKSATV